MRERSGALQKGISESFQRSELQAIGQQSMSEHL